MKIHEYSIGQVITIEIDDEIDSEHNDTVVPFREMVTCQVRAITYGSEPRVYLNLSGILFLSDDYYVVCTDEVFIAPSINKFGGKFADIDGSTYSADFELSLVYLA